jgi:hypothetical protein
MGENFGPTKQTKLQNKLESLSWQPKRRILLENYKTSHLVEFYKKLDLFSFNIGRVPKFCTATKINCSLISNDQIFPQSKIN